MVGQMIVGQMMVGQMMVGQMIVRRDYSLGGVNSSPPLSTSYRKKMYDCQTAVSVWNEKKNLKKKKY